MQAPAPSSSSWTRACNHFPGTSLKKPQQLKSNCPLWQFKCRLWVLAWSSWRHSCISLWLVNSWAEAIKLPQQFQLWTAFQRQMLKKTAKTSWRWYIQVCTVSPEPLITGENKGFSIEDKDRGIALGEWTELPEPYRWYSPHYTGQEEPRDSKK